MKRVIISLVVLASALPVQARETDTFPASSLSSSRIMLGITLPLGASRRQVYRQPRLDLRFENSHNDAVIDLNNEIYAPQQSRRDSTGPKLSLTLQKRPQFLINGKVIRSGYRLKQNEEPNHAADGENPKGDSDEGIVETALIGGLVLLLIAIGSSTTSSDCNNAETCGS